MMNTATAVTADRIYQEIDGRIQSRPAMPNLPSSPQFFQWLAARALTEPVYANKDVAEDRAWAAFISAVPELLFREKVIRQEDLKTAFRTLRNKALSILDFLPNMPKNSPEMEVAKGIVEKFSDRIQLNGMQHPITVLNSLSIIAQERRKKPVLKLKSEIERKELWLDIVYIIFDINEIYEKHYQYRESYERKGKTIASEFTKERNS